MMNREDIIRMAREADLGEPVNHDQWDADLPRLERFAALVTAHKREACAKLCDELDMHKIPSKKKIGKSNWQSICATAIRARAEND